MSKQERSEPQKPGLHVSKFHAYAVVIADTTVTTQKATQLSHNAANSTDNRV